jgi:hypothetical protein
MITLKDGYIQKRCQNNGKIIFQEKQCVELLEGKIW